MMRAAFFPWSHGVGFGYVGRALAIAEALRDAGWACTFGSDTAEGLIARAGFGVCPASGRHGTSVPDMPERRGAYIPLDSLDTVYGMTRYYHASRIREHVAQDLAIIDQVAPDVVFVDMQPTAAIAARTRGVPVISVGDSDFLRDTPNSWMPWLPPRAASILPYPSCVPAFNTVLDELGLPRIAHVSDLLWGSLTLLASTPFLEVSQPPIAVRGPLEYVGPIHWDPPWAGREVDSILDTHGAGARRRIYVTLGHGGKVLRRQVETVLEGCASDEWAVFASLGFRPLDGEPSLPANARAGEFTGIRRPIGWADLVISHGGYTTVLMALGAGRPSIVIPFMSEQEANGRLFVEAHAAGFVLRKAVPSRANGRHFDFELRYSGPSESGDFSADEVRQAVEEIFAEPAYAARAAVVAADIRGVTAGRSFARLVDRVL